MHKIRCNNYMVKKLQAFDMEKHCEIQCIHNYYCNLNTSIIKIYKYIIYFELWIIPHVVNFNLLLIYQSVGTKYLHQPRYELFNII